MCGGCPDHPNSAVLEATTTSLSCSHKFIALSWSVRFIPTYTKLAIIYFNILITRTVRNRQLLNMFSRSFRSSVTSAIKSRFYSRSRAVRGGGHDHGHHNHPQKPLEPYELPHHATYPHEAHPFGIDLKKGYSFEGWEIITALVYTGMFGILFFHTRDEKADDEFKVEKSDNNLLRATGSLELFSLITIFMLFAFAFVCF